MKIIGGEYGGRSIAMPKTRDTRPVSQLVRAAIFNTIATRVVDTEVLDLFAGSGALSIEALSRGARRATLVDIGSEAIKTIRANTKSLDLESKITANKMKVANFLTQGDDTYNIIFLDPPYAMLTEQLIVHCASRLSRDGLLVASHSNKTVLSDTIGTLTRTKESTYGDTKISYYEIAN